MTKTNDKPNIFNYATKELSQDAVICWLLDWARKQEQDVQDAEDEALRDCGRRFVKALLAEHEASLDGAIKEIEIRRQDNSIDVLARINYHNERQQILLIEDKTDTGEHGDQLKLYYEAVVGGKTGLGEVDKEDLYPIFFKTGNQSRGQDEIIEKSVKIDGRYGYRVFNRKEFLEKALNDYEGSNSILLDFRAYLQAWEDDTNSFKDWKEGERTEWSGKAWQGFFREIEEELTGDYERNRWGYVHNAAGGFFGYWWNARPIKGVEVYLQLEVVTGRRAEQRLCFKVAVGNKENYSVTRNKWHNLVCDVANKDAPKGEEKAKKPDRFGHGETMTIALWKNPWLAFSGGTLDMEKTVANLKEVEAVLAKAIEMEERQGDETQS